MSVPQTHARVLRMLQTHPGAVLWVGYDPAFERVVDRLVERGALMLCDDPMFVRLP